MIIQHVLKGISGLSEADARGVLANGIVCNWWQRTNPLPQHEIPQRLTERNLEWHQNRYSDPDPFEGNEVFAKHTPYMSVTAGTVERKSAAKKNVIHPARQVALRFATGFWKNDGWIFRCYVFILGRKSTPHAAFSEE